MSKTRDLHFAACIIGKKGTGKSTRGRAIVNKYPKEKRALVIDVNGSPCYADLPTITVDQIKHLKPWAKVKIMGTPTKQDMITIARDFKNGLVLFEDCTKYIPALPQPEIKAFLVDHRMSGCDLIFTFHALKFVPPFFWSMISVVELLKTQEDLQPTNTNKARYPNFIELYPAFNRIAAHKSNYYAETIQTYI